MQSNAALKQNNFDYARQVVDYLKTATYEQALDVYDAVMNDPNLDNWVTAQVGLHDRFFMMTIILGVEAVFKQYNPEWIYERCREVEKNPDGYLDLWAREHFKSTIITFTGSIQEIAKDSQIYQDLDPEDGWFRGLSQEITIGIFSHNNKIARDFVARIKRECEDNSNLPLLYPDVFWDNPRKDSPTWSRDDGLVMKRKGNPTEATVSGWGLVDALPTSKHFKLCIFDDTVTEKSVSTPEMIIKTTEAWELADYLSSQISYEIPPRKWHIGTRYNYADSYHVIIQRQAAIPRLYPATDTGTPDGKPVLLSDAQWRDKRKNTSPRTLACQMLQNPIAGEEQEFKAEWLRRWEIRPETLNIVICVDPASSKKKGSSNTAMAVIGIDANRNKYLLDGACHKMGLKDRWTMLKTLRYHWIKQPGIQVVKVAYEKYGMQADIEHFKEMMLIENKSFPIEEVSWPKDRMEGAKDDRIRRLIPDHANWRFFYPWEPSKKEPHMKDTRLMREAEERGKKYLCAKPIRRINEDGRVYNLFKYLVDNEILFFPATTMKDLLDAMSRFYDVNMGPPMIFDEEELLPDYLED